MKPFLTIMAMLVCWLPSAAVLAQEDSTKLILSNFFQPDFVVSHAKEINLGDPERKEIEVSTDDTLRHLRELRKKMQGETNRLGYLSTQDFVSSEEALDCLRRILYLEGQIKEQQLMLLVKIKNILKPQQEDILRTLR